MKRKVTEKDIINPGLELDLTTGYATPETILCLSDSERIRALKELEKYDDRDIIAVVFCGTLIPNGVELYGVFPQNELAEVWSSWGKPVGWYRDILQEGYIDISDWWKRKGEQYGHQKN